MCLCACESTYVGTDVGLHEEEVCWFMLLERVLQCNIPFCHNCDTNIASWWVHVCVCMYVSMSIFVVCQRNWLN